MAGICSPEELPGSSDELAGAPDEMLRQLDETAVKTVGMDKE